MGACHIVKIGGEKGVTHAAAHQYLDRNKQHGVDKRKCTSARQRREDYGMARCLNLQRAVIIFGFLRRDVGGICGAQIAQQKQQARFASEEAAEALDPAVTENRTPSKWDRNAAQPYTQSYQSSSWSREAHKIDGKPTANPNNYDDY